MGLRFQTAGVDDVGVDGDRGVVQGVVVGPCFLGDGGGGDGWVPSRDHCLCSDREAAIRGGVGVGDERVEGDHGNCCCPGAGNVGNSIPYRDGSGDSYW